MKFWSPAESMLSLSVRLTGVLAGEWRGGPMLVGSLSGLVRPVIGCRMQKGSHSNVGHSLVGA